MIRILSSPREIEILKFLKYGSEQRRKDLFYFNELTTYANKDLEPEFSIPPIIDFYPRR